jgi:hypothetical protein
MAKKQKRDPLVVVSKMKGYIRGKGMMSSSDAVAAVSEHVYNLLDAAIACAKANRCSTIRPQGL